MLEVARRSGSPLAKRIGAGKGRCQFVQMEDLLERLEVVERLRAEQRAEDLERISTLEAAVEKKTAEVVALSDEMKLQCFHMRKIDWLQSDVAKGAMILKGRVEWMLGADDVEQAHVKELNFGDEVTRRTKRQLCWRKRRQSSRSAQLQARVCSLVCTRRS